MSRFRIVIADDDSQETTLIEPLREACPEADIWQVKCLRPDADAFPKSPWLSDRDWRRERLFRCDVLILDMNIDCAPEYLPNDPGVSWRWGGEGFIQKFYNEWPGQAILMWTFHEGERMPFADALTRKQLQDGWRGPHIAKYNKSNESTLRMCESIRAMYLDFLSCGSLTDWDQIEFAASHDLPVLIVGESGTGKERLAQSIHRRWRKEKLKANAELQIPVEPAVVNCAGLSESLARAELFGFVKGSFTGAGDHRIGKCLTACGIKGFRSEKSGRANQRDIEQLRVLCRQLQEHHKLDREERIKNLQILMDLLAGRDGSGTGAGKNVFSLIESVLTEVESRAGSTYEEEFAALLRAKNNDLLASEDDRDDLDVKLRLGKQRNSDGRETNETLFGGTLFLDEFGDLPPGVQALLLRYLQDHEVAPVGYTGVIRNACARVIAATSDPKVAEMVGHQLSGRCVESVQKPDRMREDMVFRVKGQVIRVNPVDESNLDDALKREVSKHDIPWDTRKDGAIGYITEELKKILEANKKAAANGQTPPFAFGHRREISRVVRLANAFVEGAADRGIKGLPRKVTREVVERLWQPSMVTYPRFKSFPVQPTGEEEQSDQFSCLLTGTIIDLKTAKNAVEDVDKRRKGESEKTTPGGLKGNTAYIEAFLLTWFAAYYDEGGKDFWNHRAATLVFAYAGETYQADASVKRVARTLFKQDGRHAMDSIVKEAKRWKNWFSRLPGENWPFKHEDVSDGKSF